LNDVARLFLETYARGGEVEGGWKFGKALQQAQLDYSEESLERIDLLLKAIRDRAKPVHDEFIADPASRNFLSLLAFYLMAVLSRRSGAYIEWHDTMSARKAVSEWASIADGPFTRIVALAPDQGLLFLPLVWLHDRLFNLGLGQYATASDYLLSVTSELGYDLPLAWWNAARLLGVAASTQMAEIAQGRAAMPRLVWQHARGAAKNLVLDFDGEDAVARGEAALKGNPEKAVWKTFAHDATVYASGKRFDAISVTVQTYGDAPLRLRMAFRYRLAADGRPFAILDPHVWEFNIEEEVFLRLYAAVKRGIQSAAWPAGKSWNAHYEGLRDVPALLPAAVQVPPTYATGEQVRVGDAVLTDGGLYPGRVLQLVSGDDGRTACAFKDVRGARRTAQFAQVHDEVVLVSRSPADHTVACIAWLEERIKRPARGRAEAGPMLAAAHACFALGNLMWQGVAVPKNQASARQLWQAAADAGSPAAELALAVIHLDGDGVKADSARGLALLRQAAAKAYPPALARLGQELETGLRMPGDTAQAASLLAQASAAGNAHATYRLAWMHRIGKGVRHDMARCVALLAQAAAGEFAQAQYELAMHCGTGDGVPQDDERAAYWLERAVLNDHGEAMIMLAGKYERGRGVSQDLARAVTLYRRAADKKIPAAWYHLGVMAADGRGLDRDLHEAMRLMTLAAKDGIGDAKEQLEDFELAMTREARG
jgi:TPR repeat protein